MSTLCALHRVALLIVYQRAWVTLWGTNWRFSPANKACCVYNEGTHYSKPDTIQGCKQTLYPDESGATPNYLYTFIWIFCHKLTFHFSKNSYLILPFTYHSTCLIGPLYRCTVTDQRASVVMHGFNKRNNAEQIFMWGTDYSLHSNDTDRVVCDSLCGAGMNVSHCKNILV